MSVSPPAPTRTDILHSLGEDACQLMSGRAGQWPLERLNPQPEFGSSASRPELCSDPGSCWPTSAGVVCTR